MGVDLGNARVGISLADTELSIAQPLTNITVMADSFEALDDVTDLIESHAVSTVVIGLPLQMDGTDGKAAKKARRWAAQLERRVQGSITVVLRDERLTTVTAHRQLFDAGRGSRSHRSVVDQQAAVIILQSALDARKVGL